MDDVFKALADPSRRQLLDRLNERAGQSLQELCSGLDMARQSVSKHLAVLESANLVVTRRSGREKLHYLNVAPINDIADRWITSFHRARIEALADLKRALEETPVVTQAFLYTTYIKSTPERVWQALTDPAFTRRYWGITFDTDWRAGSPLIFHTAGLAIADPAQCVLEAEPYRRLSYTWHTLTPEWASAIGRDESFGETIAREPRSRVTFDIESQGDTVKLTVMHDGFEPGSQVLEMISGGWPRVLSNLKTLLETGDALEGVRRR
ncbi:MAG: metalloregulator ArsR/SmtB family transcription factor [Chloroflexi bacterium]|nr:metalloregulator ArsR/SmtB family transcription factor [Chloroflexota bacterium]